ncbi:MAG: hypothetical protein GF401_09640 [Chitinivibrionales bacterium]|nr:hypothetical protein [Chitinivibrionales bacterium]
MSIILALVAIILFVVFLLIAIRVGVNKEKSQQELHPPVIHKSGIYSIVRKSPRESIDQVKPSEEDLRKYLAAQNEDIRGTKLLKNDKELLIEDWKNDIESSISEIEEGDKEGVEFYYYSYKNEDPVCKNKISRGHFVTRGQIYKYPKIIPPFHLGCQCTLKRYSGDENLRETTVIGMQSLFNQDKLPPLPDWKNVSKIQ